MKWGSGIFLQRNKTKRQKGISPAFRLHRTEFPLSDSVFSMRKEKNGGVSFSDGGVPGRYVPLSACGPLDCSLRDGIMKFVYVKRIQD